MYFFFRSKVLQKLRKLLKKISIYYNTAKYDLIITLIFFRIINENPKLNFVFFIDLLFYMYLL